MDFMKWRRFVFPSFADEEPADRRHTNTKLEKHDTHLNHSQIFSLSFMGPKGNASVSRTPIYSAQCSRPPLSGCRSALELGGAHQ
jgi:hypothetical protein